MAKGNVFITGIAGMVGSHLAEQLILEGYNVTGIDDLSRGKTDNLGTALELARKNGTPKLSFIAAPMNYIRQEWKSMDFDTVVHLAGRRIPWCEDNPTAAIKSMGIGFHSLVRSMHRGQRLILASSASVYGRAQRFPIREKDVTRPTTLYGALKLFSENVALARGGPTWCLRFFNLIGPRMAFGGKYDEVFSKWIRAIQSGEKLKVNRNVTLDFLDVRDAVDVIMMAVRNGAGLYPGTYNVCSEQPISLEAAANQLMLAITGKSKLDAFDGPYDYRVGCRDKLRHVWSPSVLFSTSIAGIAADHKGEQLTAYFGEKEVKKALAARDDG